MCTSLQNVVFVLSRVDFTAIPYSSSVSEKIVHSLELPLFHDSSLRIDGPSKSARFARLVNLAIVSTSAVEVHIVLHIQVVIHFEFMLLKDSSEIKLAVSLPLLLKLVVGLALWLLVKDGLKLGCHLHLRPRVFSLDLLLFDIFLLVIALLVFLLEEPLDASLLLLLVLLIFRLWRLIFLLIVGAADVDILSFNTDSQFFIHE